MDNWGYFTPKSGVTTPLWTGRGLNLIICHQPARKTEMLGHVEKTKIRRSYPTVDGLEIRDQLTSWGRLVVYLIIYNISIHPTGGDHRISEPSTVPDVPPCIAWTKLLICDRSMDPGWMVNGRIMVYINLYSWWLKKTIKKYESKWVHLPQIGVKIKNETNT